ncbi:MAG: imelysin family protein [Alphaproteobacteria bacterium]|nr:imelysin family protein [Alphaproteobacteria bacterium]
MRNAFVLLLGIVVLATGPARAQPAYETLNKVLTDRVAIPAYERMADAMARLAMATQAFCKTPNPTTLGTARRAYRSAMAAWQHAQPIAFGPAVWNGRASRIQFWPDKRGTAARQIRRALNAQDPALVAKDGLRGKSVALQNLAAYERIIVGHGKLIASTPRVARDRYACALALAIARFQAALAAQILEEWTKPGGFRDAVITAAAGNEHFGDAKEASAQFLKSLAVTLDAAIRLKLTRPLGASLEKARPKRAESWRSRRSLENIRANLQTARALYDTPGGFGDLVRAAGAAPLDDDVRKSFEETAALAQAIDRPLNDAVTDGEARKQVELLRVQLRNLHFLVAGAVASEVGLVVGFNALDGD